MINEGSRGEIVSYFVSCDWTPTQAAGIVGNLIKESNLNPYAYGDSGLAYGIAQWHADRRARFRTWSGKSMKHSTLFEQLEFVNHELRSSEYIAGNQLRSVHKAQSAGRVIAVYYERPAHKEEKAIARGNMAQLVYNRVKGRFTQQ